MPIARFEMPDGRIGRFEVPEGTTPEQAQKMIAESLSQSSMQQPSKPLTAGEVATGAITNFPSSFGNLIGNIVNAISNPLETGKSILDVGAGALQNVLPERLVKAVGEDKQSREMARKVGEFYAKRYGTGEGLKRAIAEDPAGVLADLSTVLTGGSMVAPRAIAQPLARVASTIDPLAATVRATGAVANVAGRNIVAPLIGGTTGVGRESIEQAFKAGQKGGATAEQFRANISGRVNPTELLDIAKANLGELNKLKQAEYRSGMIDIKKDKSILEFADIDKSFKDADAIVAFKGKVKNDFAAQKLQDVKAAVDDWKNADPAQFHTPEGMDALKQKVRGIVDEIPFEQRTAKAALNEVYKSIRGTIEKQAPTYDKTMKDYARASDEINEIQKTLNLSDRSSVDTAMRKLQSLVRDNVQTNYGQRTRLAKRLEAGGGQEFLPGIAGQALQSFQPRGIPGQLTVPTSLASFVAGGGGLGGVAAALGTSAISSPRLMGEAAFGTGLASRGAREFGRLVPPAVDPRMYNLLYQSGQIPGLLEE